MRILILVMWTVLAGPAFAADPPAEKKAAFKPPPGYKVKIHGWDLVYCRQTPVLGSRFKKEVCMTEAELKAHLASNDEMRRSKDQWSRVCSGSACD